MQKLVTFLFFSLFTTLIIAQDLPKTSPACTVNQVVGLTEFSISYSRPSVNDRTIIGELVPYDKVWRLGANECTKITSSSEFTVGGTVLEAGTYALFAIPSKSGEWSIVFNTDIEQWGSNDYDSTKNKAAIKVLATENSFTETLVIEFNELTANTGVISIQWENIKVDVPFSVNTEKIAENNINTAIEKGENLVDVYNNAANYYISLEDYTKATMYVDKSISIEKNYKNLFLKAKIFNETEENDKAIKTAKKALKLAEKADAQRWANYISKTIEKWSK